MTIGNIHSKIRNSPSNNAWILVALLPVPPTCTADSAPELREYQGTKAENLHHILRELLGDFSHTRYRGMDMRCADGKIRCCYLSPCGWVADYLEYTKLYNLENKGCPVCEVSASDLGEHWNLPPRDEWVVNEHGNAIPRSQTPIRTLESFNTYEENAFELRRLSKMLVTDPQVGTRSREIRRDISTEIAGLKAYFKSRKQKPVRSALWKVDLRTPISNYETAVSGFDNSMGLEGTLWKPDLLHSMYQGMLKHLMDWLEGFLGRHNKLKAFDRVWRRIPSYPGLVTPTKGYRYVLSISHTAVSFSDRIS